MVGGSLGGAIGAAAGAIGGLLGAASPGSQTLSKLEITPLTFPDLQPRTDKTIKVLFNPTSYSIGKEISWTEQTGNLTTLSGQPLQASGQQVTKKGLNAPPLEFGGGAARTLSMELFFDVTEPIDGKMIDDVRKETNKIVKLTIIERNPNYSQPPVCDITWGSDPPPSSDFPFRGVLVSLDQRFTLFKSSGQPVRARLTVRFKEFLDPEADLRRTDPDLTTRIVKRGDTLSSIAAEMYSDPRRWRIIAEANNLDNPRQLTPGQSLVIPALR